jgi:hypothetical protein
MWVELAALRFLEGEVRGRFAQYKATEPISAQFWCPESAGRINDVHRDTYLERMPQYVQYGVTLRIVLLSAAFEEYFEGFLATYLSARAKYWDKTQAQRTTAGNKVWNEVMTKRGLVLRIEEFARQTGAGIKTITPLLSVLGDVYVMRNVMAHCAGIIDTRAIAKLQRGSFAPGSVLTLNTDSLLEMATAVLKIAEILDRKIDPEQPWVRP